MLGTTPWRLAAAAALALLTGCESGPEITPARWASQPTAGDMAEAYPDFARMARIPGKVKMRCHYTLDGVLERCRKIGVAPEGLNFDRHVPRLLAKYVVVPQTYDGRPAPSSIDFVIAFNPSPTPAAYAGQPVTDGELAALRRKVGIDRERERRMAQYIGSRTVELDRSAAVAAIVDRAYAAEDSARYDAMLRGVVQALTPAERRVLASNDYVTLPTLAQIEAVSPEFHAANARLATRMRSEYCAAYSCDTTLPAPPPAP